MRATYLSDTEAATRLFGLETGHRPVVIHPVGGYASKVYGRWALSMQYRTGFLTGASITATIAILFWALSKAPA